MPTTLTNTGPNLRAEGQREVLGSLMALWLTSLVLHAVLQANQFSPWPLLPESSSLPGMIWIIILLGLASYAVVFWVRAFRTCLDGANKIRANGADEAVIFASGIGSLCGLAIVVWIKGGKAGLWEWVGWMGWPAVATATAMGLFIVRSETRNSGRQEQRLRAEEEGVQEERAKEDRITREQKIQAVSHFRRALLAARASTREGTLYNKSTGHSMGTLQMADLERMKTALARMQTAIQEMRTAVMQKEIDFGQVETATMQMNKPSTQMETAFMHMMVDAIQDETDATPNLDGWEDVKRARDEKSEQGQLFVPLT